MRTLKITILIIVSLFCLFVKFHTVPEKRTVTSKVDQVNCLASTLYYDANKNLEHQKAKALVIFNQKKYNDLCDEIQKDGIPVVGWKETIKRNTETFGITWVVADNLYWLQFHNQNKGIEQIEHSEGFSDHAYFDVSGYAIGFGTQLKNKELYKKYRFAKITPQDAEKLMVYDIIDIEMSLRVLIKVPITDNQYYALLSFSYNEGTTRLAKSELLKDLNNGQFQDAANQFSKWVYSSDNKVVKGLVYRRNEERTLFLEKQSCNLSYFML